MNGSDISFFDPVWQVVLVIFRIALAIGLVALTFGGFFAFLCELHFILTLPLRRTERARVFLDLLESTIKQGQPLEENLISLSHSRDLSMGVKFHVLAAWLETGLPFAEARARVPRFLPPQVNAMLDSGQKLGDLTKVLPACRQLLKDSNSQIRGALNYVLLITFVITPVAGYIFIMLELFVLPKFMEVFAGMGITSGTGLLLFLNAHLWSIILSQLLMLVVMWAGVLLYVGGPRLVAWLPILEWLHYRLPWRRRRMQRDFSTMLAVLVDAGVPEGAALTMAADCTANSVMQRRAARALAALRQGTNLPDAVHLMDGTGEFRWRLRNATASPMGFFRALAGWHESLDACAFQQEQAAAHIVTTSLVLWSGLFVGSIMIAIFMVFTSLINRLSLW